MCTSAGNVLPERWAVRELGGKQGLVVAERERLSADYAKAVANVQTRSAQIYFQKEEALNYRSARETNIAVVGGLFAEGGDAVSTRGAHLLEGAARWPPHMHGNGANTHPNQPHRLMGWGVSASAFPQPISRGRETAGQHPDVSGQFGKLIFFVAVAPHRPPGRGFRFRRSGAAFSYVGGHHLGSACME
ncbi:putative trans-sialidase [Trypanosoma cruzi]|nr:putative trans-sialidase [Trypanosoma cruzi]